MMVEVMGVQREAKKKWSWREGLRTINEWPIITIYGQAGNNREDSRIQTGNWGYLEPPGADRFEKHKIVSKESY